jgi:hypothetical protein
VANTLGEMVARKIIFLFNVDSFSTLDGLDMVCKGHMG